MLVAFLSQGNLQVQSRVVPDMLVFDMLQLVSISFVLAKIRSLPVTTSYHHQRRNAVLDIAITGVTYAYKVTMSQMC